MELDLAAKALKELGHQKRLLIFKHLVKSGYDGLPVGKVQDELNIPASTLSHHVSKLIEAGLIKQKRKGTVLYCLPQYKTLIGLINFLQEECCSVEIDKDEILPS